MARIGNRGEDKSRQINDPVFNEFPCLILKISQLTAIGLAHGLRPESLRLIVRRFCTGAARQYALKAEPV